MLITPNYYQVCKRTVKYVHTYLPKVYTNYLVVSTKEFKGTGIRNAIENFLGFLLVNFVYSRLHNVKICS